MKSALIIVVYLLLLVLPGHSQEVKWTAPDRMHLDAMNLFNAYVNDTSFTKSHNAWYEMGKTMYRAELWREAARCFDEALTDYRYEPDYYYWMAKALIDYNAYCFRYYIENYLDMSLKSPLYFRNTDSSLVMYEKIRFRIKTQETEGAFYMFDDALRMGADTLECLIAIANMNLTDSDTATAADQYRMAIGLNPRHPIPYYNLGVVCMDRAKYDSAAIYFEKATDVLPGYRDALYYTGLALFRNKQFHKALPYFEKVLPADSTNMELTNALRQCYLRTDQMSKAFELDSVLMAKYEFEGIQYYLNMGLSAALTGRYQMALDNIGVYYMFHNKFFSCMRHDEDYKMKYYLALSKIYALEGKQGKSRRFLSKAKKENYGVLTYEVMEMFEFDGWK